MAGMINSLEAAVLDHVLNKASYTPPVSWYVALATDATAPTETGTNFTEVSGGAYARQAVTTSGWNAASGGDPSVIDNNGAIQFATATAFWGNVRYFGLFTGSSGGTVQIWGQLTADKSVATNDRFQFPSGDLDVKLGDPGDTYT